jgi:hypothetical protein
MLEWPSRLKLCFLCNEVTPISTIPSRFTPLPLILSVSVFHPRGSPHFKEEFFLALQRRDHVCAIFIKRSTMGSSGLREALNNVFPKLEALSLSDCYEAQLPSDFVAPRLRTLHLQNIAIPKGSLLITNATNLLSLHLEYISASGYLRPEYLVECIACMPHLWNLSISFPIDLNFFDTVFELPDTQTTRIVLPKLSRLSYRGISAYLESLLAQICAPVLQDFHFTPSSQEIPAVHRLPAFLDTIQNFNFQTAVVSFSKLSVAIACRPKQPSVILPHLGFLVHDAWQQARVAAVVVQICSAIAPVLPAVENLELTMDHIRPWQFSQLPPTFWHAFLRPFGSVKTLTVDMALAAVLSDALHPINGTVVKELLPALSELDIRSSDGLIHQSLSTFLHARRRSGQSIYLRLIQDSPTFWPAPCFPRYFDTLASIDHV